MKRVWLIAALLAATPIGANAAGIVNGGFETGDLTGWTLIGAPNVGVVTQFAHPPPAGAYFPVEGAEFAHLNARMFQTNVQEGLFQDLDFNGFQRLDGAAAFLSNSIDAGFNVEGFVRLTDSSGHAFNLFHQQTVGLGDFGATPWINFGIRPSAGHYRLEAYVFDHTNDAQQSADLLLDAFRITPVPEPATWALLISGFALAGVGLRRARPAGSRRPAQP